MTALLRMLLLVQRQVVDWAFGGVPFNIRFIPTFTRRCLDSVQVRQTSSGQGRVGVRGDLEGLVVDGRRWVSGLRGSVGDDVCVTGKCGVRRRCGAGAEPVRRRCGGGAGLVRTSQTVLVCDQRPRS